MKKSLGQHFLRCQWVISTLIQEANIEKDDVVLEIGPGGGILTRALAARAKRVIAVEKDERLAQTLREELTQEKINNFEIIEGDILHLLSRLILDSTWSKVVANIPYYLTSRLIRLLLEGPKKPERIVLTIQKEVAERIVAKPPHMNLLGLSVQVFGKPRLVKKVPASCFSPTPKVDSAVITIEEISDAFFIKNKIDKAVFFDIVKGAFSQKRKQLAHTLKRFFPDTKDIGKKLLTLGIKAKARPQELRLEDWAKLTIEAKPR